MAISVVTSGAAAPISLPLNYTASLKDSYLYVYDSFGNPLSINTPGSWKFVQKAQTVAVTFNVDPAGNLWLFDANSSMQSIYAAGYWTNVSQPAPSGPVVLVAPNLT